MFIDGLLNQGNAPLLEQAVRFAGARHRLILENIANVDTPCYVQKDLSIQRFRKMLIERLDRPRRERFKDLQMELENPEAGILFHDRNNRSMEHLASDLAKNAMMHNVAVEMLRKQFRGMEMALKERVE